MAELRQDKLENFPQLKFLVAYLDGHPGIIAGGCFKSIFSGKRVHDVDMFFRSCEDYLTTVQFFTGKTEEYDRGYANLNVTSFVNKQTQIRVECNKKIFGDPEDILRQFDFTIAKFALENQARLNESPLTSSEEISHEEVVTYHEQFFEHLCLKRLVVDDKIPYPVGTFNRTYKYARDGFFPCRETKLKIMRAIQQLDENVLDDDLASAMYEGWD